MWTAAPRSATYREHSDDAHALRLVRRGERRLSDEVREALFRGLLTTLAADPPVEEDETGEDHQH